MTAPVASGWSISPGGAYTHKKAPPLHGAHPKRSYDFPESGGLTINARGAALSWHSASKRSVLD